jgi:hypothetical protein
VRVGTRLRLACTLVLLIVCAGCGAANNGGAMPVQEDKSQTVKVTGAPLVVVESDAGPVTVAGGGDGSVAVEWKKRAPGKADAKDMQVSVATATSQVTISYHYTGQTAANRAVEFNVTMPKGAKLQVNTKAGPVSVSGLEQGAAVTTGGGPIEAKGVSGDLQLTSGGGNVSASGVDGAVTAQTTGGAIKVGGRLQGANTLHSAAGLIDVTVSAGSNLAVSAATSAGAISNDFGFGPDGQIGDGSGGALDLATGAGNIAIHKAK